jgi:23S rRNA pseudouridine1911/1915/1917 synthase
LWYKPGVPEFPLKLIATATDAGQRVDLFLVAQVPEISRMRAQQLIAAGQVLVNGAPAKPSLRLRATEHVELLSPPKAPPLRASPEDISLDIVYEDDDLAIINKPAGMMVHAGAGRDDARDRGTLVNALLHRFGALSGVSGDLRPGIVHRLDKNTSGLIVVAKNDVAHRKLAEQFSRRTVKKKYLALVHGWLKADKGSIETTITRDQVRRTRMTTRGRGGRHAISRYRVLRRIASPYGKFSLVEVTIETGRTHQIRVHMASLGHPVVGDTLYGAARELHAKNAKSVSLPRNFLHAAAIELLHPSTAAPLAFSRPLPIELREFLEHIERG